ncbi:MAG: tol-pal system protein YbgF [Acidobacteriota bacterium]
MSSPSQLPSLPLRGTQQYKPRSWRSLRLPMLLALAVLMLPSTGCTSGQELENLQTQLADLQRQILEIQRQMPNRGDIEALQRQLDELQLADNQRAENQAAKLIQLTQSLETLDDAIADQSSQIGRFEKTLDQAVQEFKAARASAANAAPPPPPVTIPAVSSQDPESLYRAGYNDYLRGNFDLAIDQFQLFISTFADDELIDNAIYWLGESYYRQGKFRLAVGQFDTVLSRYPSSDKVASSLLKKGYAYLELGERSEGILQLQRLMRQYPGSDEANLAQQRLEDLGVLTD